MQKKRRATSAVEFLAHLRAFLFPGRVANTRRGAARYLNNALRYMRWYAVKSDQVDWNKLYTEARKRIEHASSPAETYETIKWALSQLGDHHSLFLTPEQSQQLGQGKMLGMGLLLSNDGVVIEVLPESPAGKASIDVGDRIISLDGEPLSQENLSRVYNSPSLLVELQPRSQQESRTVSLEASPFYSNRLPTARILHEHIGLLELPSFLGNDGEIYAQTAQRALQELDKNYTLTGWIIDLRRNTGGDMWPMLAGVGPILGEGKVGSFVHAGGSRVPWLYQRGQARAGRWVAARVTNPYQLKQAMPPVAVLTSENTISSGEALAVAFRGRPRTRSFGEPTAGLPTANQGFKLPDGAMLQLTTALDVDRNGVSYDGSLVPDQEVPLDWSQLETDQDLVVLEALKWLQQQ
ncbi:hypothetical protein EPA93_08885 [Ktedonosporobacter rubrisoli]|uniref:PDZ domain-containing protein n=1 Tax=Ktedonosporobacter rubrisoli TaxID=2509675 RepID=A0A4P6JLJ2_KTERU|nr:S41 family peptidase [Ktedonosporobacter rubrisoli]QBD76117.1 hypothetical protein EPA93_08885 [Ktedonosporobacter rubrisoli]